MPIRDTKYSFRYPHPDVIQRGADQVLYVESRTAGAIAEPASGTCTVRDSNGDTVKTGAIVVTDSLATFTLLAADTSTLDFSAGWRVVWSLVMPDGRTYDTENPAALCRRKLYPVLSDLDLTEGRYSDLNRYLDDPDTGSWQPYRDSAWNEIQRLLFRVQLRPWLVTEPSAFLDPHRELTLANIFENLGSTQRTGDRDWLSLAAEHRRRFSRAFDTSAFDYDTGVEDGVSTSRRSARPITVLGAVGALYRR